MTILNRARMKSIVLPLFFVICAFTANAQSKEVSPDEFQKMIEGGGVQLVDVRTPGEFKKGSISGAVNYDINSRDFTSKIKSLDKDRPVFVYCLSGGRSQKAAAIMRRQGYETVELKGGMMAWTGAGKEISEGSKAGLTMAEFNDSVKSDKLVLVDFHARWCGPCKKMAPDLETLRNTFADQMILFKVDADDNPIVVETLKIQAIPRLELYKGGVKVWSHTGYLGKKDIEKQIRAHL